MRATRHRRALVCMLAALSAHAEPQPSLAHLPVLWGITIVVAVVLGVAPVLIKKFARLPMPMWAVLLLSVGLVLSWAIIGPIFIALASILIAGRTM